MGQLIYVGDTEIEQEPDNDSDDAGFSSTPDNPSHPLALPIVMQSPPDATNFQSTAQQIVTQLANIAGQPLSYVYQAQADGSVVMNVKDSNGNLTNTIVFFSDGTTDNTTPMGVNTAETISLQPSSDPHTTAVTSLFNPDGANLGGALFNSDGTSVNSSFTQNTDGSMSFLTASPPSSNSPSVAEPSSGNESTIMDDAGSFALDEALDLFKKSTSATVRNTADFLGGIKDVFDNVLTATEFGTLGKKLYDEWSNGQPMATTATELMAKTASTAMGLALKSVPVIGKPLSSFADTSVKGWQLLGNLAIPPLIDAYFEWKESNGQQSTIDNTLQHTDIQPNNNTGPYLYPQSASTDTSISSQVLYEWSGLDTAGFPDVAWDGVGVGDVTKNMTNISTADLYNGPVSGLQYQYINGSPDNLNVTGGAPDMFIHTGAGDDAIDISKNNGNNVLDGSTGSNFLVGGTGNDTFFVDDRSPPADIWSTVANFHAGDAATIFGITQQGFDTSWVDGQGATGYTGLTLHVTSPGHPTASLTLAGFSTADLSNGRISNTWGTEPDGTPYLYVHANS